MREVAPIVPIVPSVPRTDITHDTIMNSTTIVSNSTNPWGGLNENGTLVVAPAADDDRFPSPFTNYTDGTNSTDMFQGNINSTLYYSDYNVNALSNENSTNQIDVISAEGSGEQMTPGVVLWSSFLILMFCMSVRPAIPDPNHRAALLRYRQQRQREEERKKDPERRQRVVESSLVTMRVVSCDENHTLRLGALSGSIASLSLEEDSSFSITSLEDERRSACVICLEAFRKNDCVTWSKSMECRHVFHHECLEEWLVNPKHDDCPACRCQIVHDDDEDEDDDLLRMAEQDGQDGHQQRHSSSSLAFVIMNGLISPLRRARDSIIGSSINLGGDRQLRRVLSSDASPSRFGVVFRRVSSGIYSRFSGTFDSQDCDNDYELPRSITDPSELRRTRSEGLPITPKRNNLFHFVERSNSDVIDHTLDLELGDDSEEHVEYPNIRPRTIHFGFLPSSGSNAYAKLAVADPSSIELHELSDDEDSLESREMIVDEDEDVDISASVSQ